MLIELDLVLELRLDLVLELSLVLLAVLVSVLRKVPWLGTGLVTELDVDLTPGPRLATGLELLAWDLLDLLGDFGTRLGRQLRSSLVSLTCSCLLSPWSSCICEEVEGKESLSLLSPAGVWSGNGRRDESSVSQWVSILKSVDMESVRSDSDP